MKVLRYALIPVLALALTPSWLLRVRAEIIGFNVGSYAYNQGDTGTPPAVGPDSIQLTTGNRQRRSLFFDAKQDISQFTASFNYRAANVAGSLTWQGIALVLQNSADGIDALGGGSGGLGFTGVAPSAAVTIQMDTGPGQTYNGFFTNGVLGSGAAGTLPVNAFNGREIGVTIQYNNPVLSVTLNDPMSGPFHRDILVGSLASILGSSTAYVGFTASAGDSFGNGGANQYLSNFRFTNVPEPSSVMLLMISGCLLIGWCRRRQ